MSLARGSPERAPGGGNADSDLCSPHLNCRLSLPLWILLPHWLNGIMSAYPLPTKGGAYSSSLFCKPKELKICTRASRRQKAEGVSICPDGWLLSPEQPQPFLWVSAIRKRLVSASPCKGKNCVCQLCRSIGAKGLNGWSAVQAPRRDFFFFLPSCRGHTSEPANTRKIMRWGVPSGQRWGEETAPAELCNKSAVFLYPSSSVCETELWLFRLLFHCSTWK